MIWYLIVGEVVFLLVSVMAGKENHVDDPRALYGGTVLGIVAWPITLAVFVFVFARSMRT